MSPTAEKLLVAVRALPEDERTEVIETLVDEFDSSEFDPEWVAAIDRHSDEIEAGLVDGILWEELEKKLLAKYGDSASVFVCREVPHHCCMSNDPQCDLHHRSRWRTTIQEVLEATASLERSASGCSERV